VRNVPVPPVPIAVRWPALDSLRSLRTVDLFGRLQRAVRPRPAIGFTSTWTDAKMDDVLRRTLEDLKGMNAARGSTLVLVHFVRRAEIRADRPARYLHELSVPQCDEDRRNGRGTVKARNESRTKRARIADPTPIEIRSHPHVVTRPPAATKS